MERIAPHPFRIAPEICHNLACMTQPNYRPPGRALWGVVLVSSCLWIGLAVGTAIGARFVPPGSGLAGPAIALGYGVFGAALAAALAGLMIWRLPARALRAVGIAGLGLSLALLGMAAWRMSQQRSERRAAAGLDEPLPAPSSFQLQARLSEADPTRSFREMSIDGADWSFRYIAVGPEAAVCTGQLTASEATLLKERISTFEQRANSSEPPCPSNTEPELFHIDFTGQVEASTPATQWSVSADMACMQRESEMMSLHTALRRIPLDAVGHGRVECE